MSPRLSAATRIDSLNALRGLAAAIVLVYHCAELLWGSLDKVPAPLSRGYLAVDLFFLLSGFVLAHADGAAFASRVRLSDVKFFLWSRFARTYPVHILVLAALLPFYGSAAYPAGTYSGLSLLGSVFLIQGPWLGYVSWNFGAWSLSAEWHAYLLFPLLVRLVWDRPAAVLIGIAVACLAVLGVAVAENGNSASLVYGLGSLSRCLTEFIVGMILYRAYREKWIAPIIGADRTFAVCAAFVVLLASCPGTDIAVIAALGVLLLASANNHGRVANWLGLGPFQFLGKISYSLYMVQMIAAAFPVFLDRSLGRTLDGPIRAAAMTGFSIALAIPLSKYFEYPMRRLIRDWASGGLAAKPGEAERPPQAS
jgi:peptidoglycan/LPS O-acetylase OafA/YrhL